MKMFKEVINDYIKGGINDYKFSVIFKKIKEDREAKLTMTYIVENIAMVQYLPQ